ncbi:MAG: hypothetical protein HY908_06825, partial [Myxococcales bacterium]|nr:hypothetical protein [Myxococcales bacterium]
TSAALPPASPAEQARWVACGARRDALRKEPALPGAPAVEKIRPEMARVRGRPLVWRRVPAPAPELEARIAKGKALTAVRDLIHKRRKDPAALRRAVLREGYLFHEDVEVGLALVEQLSLVKLFEEPEIWLQRGALVMPLKRMPKDKQYFLPERYVYTAGDRPGSQAEILHGDRVAVTRAEVDKDVLSVDVLDATAVGGFDRIKPEHLTASALVAELRYGPDAWVPAVLDLDGPRLRVGCEALTPELDRKKKAFLTEDALARRALRRLRETIRLEIDEELPFDAPKGGEEAEEGDLRREFDRAYKQGLRYFAVDPAHRRDVYDEKGRPLPPQVCIDFLVDTLERAGGKWYAPMQGSPLKPAPARTKGLLDFDGMSLDNRRSVASFVEMAKTHQDLFDVWDNPKRIPFTERKEFFDYLADNADALDPLDLVIIFGTKKGKPHYHSMIVLEKDPVSGVPTLIVSNAVVPKEQTLEGIMQISPKRSIKSRIRLKHPWVAALASLAAEPKPGDVPPSDG